MKIKKQHIILFFCFLTSLNFLEAQSAMDRIDRKEQQLREFQTARVSEAKLHAFTKRAEQKLKDYFAYWELMLNQEYPLEMREEALETGAACFNRQAKLNFNFLGRMAKSPKEILDRAIAGKAPKVKFLNVQQQSALVWENDRYIGQMKFSVKAKGKTQAYIVNIEIRKLKKRFGRRTELIWEVELGDVQPLP